jgi:hypothetical protein
MGLGEQKGLDPGGSRPFFTALTGLAARPHQAVAVALLAAFSAIVG